MSPRIALYLFHVLLPVASVASLVVVLQVTWRTALHSPGVIALLGGVVVVYTGDRLLERHAELGRLLVRWLLTLGALAALAVGWQVLLHPSLLLPVVLPLAALAVAYPALSRLPLAKELTVALCWTLGVAVLPFADEAPRWGLLAEPAAWAVFALVLAGTLLCDLKDELVDRERQVASAPVLLGDPWTRLIAAAAALDAVWLAWWGEAYALLLACFLLTWLATQPELLKRSLWGPITVDAVLAIPGPVAWLAASW